MSFDYELFKNPAAKYRGFPFWSWNCRLSRDNIKEQLLIFKEMGMGGVVIHPREGLDTEYMGGEFLDIAKYAVRLCRRLGLICWLYDDDRFPSGAADGAVTKNPCYRGRQLCLTEHALTGCKENEAEFLKSLKNGEVPDGYYLTAYSLELCEQGIKSYSELKTEAELEAAIGRGERVRYAYLILNKPEEWFNGQTYTDTMNPEATDEFIRVTHERYKSVMGDCFGGTVQAIFTDEPRLGKQGPLAEVMSHNDAYVPYTEYFAAWFKERNGFDALSIVPEYVWDMADGSRRNRYLYRDGVCECFSEVFMDRICRWCAKNGIKMTGHILGEENLLAQTTMVGSAMRTYKNMDIPGVDLLIDGREFTTVKQAASVARQYGREGAMSEEYGGTQWDCTFKTYKLQGDWQAALGITHRVQHLSHMTIMGEAKRDWPASIFYQSPWYREYPYIENHFARLNTVLRRGTRITRIAVVHPVESYWVLYGTEKETRAARRKIDNEFKDITSWLLYGLVDFDYLCESLLPEQCASYEGGMPLKVGECGYERVIVPDMVTIRSTTLSVLERFAKTGREVIFAGGVPEYVDGVRSDRAERLARRCAAVPFTKSDILSAVDDLRDIKIMDASGAPSENLFCQLRQDRGRGWLYICHVNPGGCDTEKYTIRIKGEYGLTLYDTMTGERYAVKSNAGGGFTETEIVCHGEDSFLIELKKRGAAEYNTYAPKTDFEPVCRLNEIKSFKRSEPNALVLDYAAAELDGTRTYAREEILRLDNKLRADMGFFVRNGRNRQPWATEEGETHCVKLIYEFMSEISVPARLGIENPQICDITLNGAAVDVTPRGWYIDKSIKVLDLPDIKRGVNRLEIKLGYNCKTQPESVYILGDFGVGINGNRTVITADAAELRFGSITEQGMPFYTGNIDYVFDADIECDGEYYIRVPEFKAPLLGVSVDGEKKGLIAFSPHRVGVGALCRGRHTVSVTLYGSRQNIFGTLHNADENYTWYGNDAYRTTGWQWTDGYMLRGVGIMSDVIIEK